MPKKFPLIAGLDDYIRHRRDPREKAYARVYAEWRIKERQRSAAAGTLEPFHIDFIVQPDTAKGIRDDIDSLVSLGRPLAPEYGTTKMIYPHHNVKCQHCGFEWCHQVFPVFINPKFCVGCGMALSI